MRPQSTLISGLLVFLLSFTSLAQDKPRVVVQDGHDGVVLRLSFLSEGLEGATASADGTVKLWDLVEGRVSRTIYDRQQYKRHDGLPRLLDAIFFPDERQVLTCDHHGVVRLFNLDSGALLGKFQLEERPDRLVSDGQALFYTSTKKLHKIDLKSGKFLGEFPIDRVLGSFADDSVSLSPGLLSVAHSEEVFLLDPKDLSIKYRYPVDRASRAALSPDGKSLALSTTDFFLELETQTGRVLTKTAVEEVYKTPPSSPAARNFRPYWSRDGRLFWGRVSNDHEGIANFLERKNGKVQKADYNWENEYVYALDSLSNGSLLVSTFIGNFSLLDSQGGRRDYSSQNASVSALAMSPSGDALFSGSPEGPVKSYSTKTGRLDKTYLGLNAYVKSVDVSPDGKKVVANDYSQGRAIVWDVESGKKLSEFQVQNVRARWGTGIQQVKFVDSQRYILIRVNSGRVSIVDANSGKEVDYRDFGKRGVREIALHPTEARVATLQKGGMVTEWGLARRRDVLGIQVPGKVGASACLTYSQDGESLLFISKRDIIYRWFFDDPANKPERFTQGNHDKAVHIDETAGVVRTLGQQGVISRFTSEGRFLDKVAVGGAYVSKHLWVNSDLLLINSEGDAIVFYNPKTGDYLGELIEFDGGKGWVVFTEDGRFDGNEAGFNKLDYELDGTIYRLSQFFNDYFQPGLLATLLPAKKVGHRPKRSVAALTSKTLKKPPKVDIQSPTSGAILEKADFEVTVVATPQGAGVSQVSLFHNGHRLPDSARTKVNQNTYTFKVKAVKGLNDLRASAYDASGGVESRKDRVRVSAPNLKARPPRLHLFAVGVDTYKSGLNLKFAKKDATSVASLFQSKLYEPGERVVLTNQDATLSRILEEVGKISDASEPQDALIVYLAGHGTVLGETYYFLPHDTDINNDQSLATSALSSERLAKILSEVSATKQLLVLDSCRSGAAVGALSRALGARSGLEEVRSQQLLARTSGTFLIAATKADEYAYEIPQLGHGILTYALLNSLGLTGKGDSLKSATANSLLQSVSTKVPQLSEKYHGVRQQVIQYSSGQDFPLTK